MKSFIIPMIFFCFCAMSQMSQKNGGLYTHTVSSTSTAGGLAFLDFNNDGLEDVYVTNRIDKDQLFLNIGYNRFKDVTEEAGGFLETGVANTLGVKTGDFDNDGYTDLFVTVNSRSKHNLLYKNNGDGTFTEMSETAGIEEGRESVDAVLADINKDGLLDIYVLNYIKSGETTLDSDGAANGYTREGFPNQLYINKGDWLFEEMADTYGVADEGCSQAGLAFDYDGDGDMDLLSLNDFGEWHIPNKLYVNQYPERHFDDLSNFAGLDAAIYSMGVAPGDYNNDGFIDLYITNLGANILHRNNGDGTYTDTAEEFGLDNTHEQAPLLSVGWGALFFDMDNDGDDDLYLANGYLGMPSFIETNIHNRNHIWENKNDSFQDRSVDFGMDHPGKSRGAAVADTDLDGDLDILVTLANNVATGNNHALYYVNEYEKGNYVKVKLEGSISNRSAIGSKVILETKDRKMVKEVYGGSSSSSQNSLVQHFGLDSGHGIEKLVIEWPSGIVQEFAEIPINQMYYVKEGEEIMVAGCKDVQADNFDSAAELNYGCMYEVAGCLDKEAINFNPDANTSSGNCENVLGFLENEISFIWRENRLQFSSSPGIGQFMAFSVLGERLASVQLKNNKKYYQTKQLNGLVVYKIILDDGRLLSGQYIIK